MVLLVDGESRGRSSDAGHTWSDLVTLGHTLLVIYTGHTHLWSVM